MIVIKKITKLKDLYEQDFPSSFQRICFQLDKFESIELFHIKRKHNQEVDALANQGVRIEQEMIIKDQGVPHTQLIP